MKRRVIFIVIPIILVLAVLTSPALAKGPEQPDKGLLWGAVTSLQEGLSTLAKQLNDGLELLQGQIDSIQAYLANFTEEDPVFSAMDTEAELETQVGENILTSWENISLLNNDVGYITKSTIYSETIREESGFVTPLMLYSWWYREELPSNCAAISASGRVMYRKLDGTYETAEPWTWYIVPYVERDEVRYYVTITEQNDGFQHGLPCTHFVFELTYLYVMSPN